MVAVPGDREAHSRRAYAQGDTIPEAIVVAVDHEGLADDALRHDIDERIVVRLHGHIAVNRAEARHVVYRMRARPTQNDAAVVVPLYCTVQELGAFAREENARRS